MPRPPRRSRFELQLTREADGLKTVIVCLRRELQDRQSYASKLECLLRERRARIDELMGRLAQVREQNKRLDAENEHLAEMIRFEPQLDATMLTPELHAGGAFAALDRLKR